MSIPADVWGLPSYLKIQINFRALGIRFVMRQTPTILWFDVNFCGLKGNFILGSQNVRRQLFEERRLNSVMMNQLGLFINFLDLFSLWIHCFFIKNDDLVIVFIRFIISHTQEIIPNIQKKSQVDWSFHKVKVKSIDSCENCDVDETTAHLNVKKTSGWKIQEENPSSGISLPKSSLWNDQVKDKEICLLLHTIWE